MLELALQTPSSKVVVLAVWRLFDRLSGGPNSQVLIWGASLFGFQGALLDSFLLQGRFLNSLVPESCFLICSLFHSLDIDRLLVGFLGISPDLDGSFPSCNLLLIDCLLL